MSIGLSEFKRLALSFPGTEEQPHFSIPSFRFKNKIFATLLVKEKRAMVKLPIVEQSVFCSYDDSIFFPVSGAWGRQGATFVELKMVRKDMIKDALTVAYEAVAKEKSKSTKRKKV